MLSAIAARKAAQAANAVSLPTPEPPVDPVPPSPVEAPPSHSRPTSKRKSSSQAPNSSRKRKKKREAELKKTRYFEAESDPFHNSDDVIIIDSDDEDLSDAPPAPITRTATNVVGKRAWSPSAPINDSSDEEGEDILDVLVPVAAHPGATHGMQALTSFRALPDKTVFYLESEEKAALGLSTETATLISLSAGQTVSLLGTYMFTVLQGAVFICGVRVPANVTAHCVYAPRSSPIPIIEALDEKVPLASISAVPVRLRPVFESSDTLVVLHPFDSGVEGLGKICRTFDGVFKPSRWQDSDAGHYLQLPGVHMLIQPSKDIQPFILPPSWEIALSSLSDSASGIFLIKGHKKSGKSTFARTLLNRLLCRYRRVAFLECDLGQSEFTPGGLVALNIIERLVFGPPFTHPTLPNFAHYLGVTTPRSSPSHYVASIQALVEAYQLDVQTPTDDGDGDSRISDVIPLIVNTMGWTKGLGADLTRKIEDIVQPTDIFEVEAPFFEHPSSFEHPPRVPNDPQSPKLHLLQPIAPSVLSTNYSASDHRSAAILSYFHAIIPRTAPKGLEQVTATRWNTMLPLCAHPPYEVDWSLAFDRITLCGAGSEDVVPSEINRVLNGALVGLVAYEPGSLDDDVDMLPSSSDPDAALVPPIPYTQGSPVPSPSTSMCHGVALIRAISPSSSNMHILTPLPPAFVFEMPGSGQG
ncbi:Polynucleotide 5'-hydroxyl-kinase GRC3 [Mycena venus]|uniref:Polynucleotide 5'-hydroxyl-kinase GRC3 n=1 Tax=Mycena venus TaxID=2733690 RepID=A0A8H7D024_9AGAR|nr:Polynucleotide 5'-hydroxyl-kinase GRC3 [Mycena venus]